MSTINPLWCSSLLDIATRNATVPTWMDRSWRIVDYLEECTQWNKHISSSPIFWRSSLGKPKYEQQPSKIEGLADQNRVDTFIKQKLVCKQWISWPPYKLLLMRKSMYWPGRALQRKLWMSWRPDAKQMEQVIWSPHLDSLWYFG